MAISVGQKRGFFWRCRFRSPANSSGKKIILEIADHGDGIPPDMMEHARERFYRANKSSYTIASGF